MTIPVEIEVPDIVGVTVTDENLIVDVSDGWTIFVPTGWFPRLAHASLTERTDWRLIGGGQGVHWEALDEDISVESVIAGKPSGESQESLRRWLRGRQEP